MPSVSARLAQIEARARLAPTRRPAVMVETCDDLSYADCITGQRLQRAEVDKLGGLVIIVRKSGESQ